MTSCAAGASTELLCAAAVPGRLDLRVKQDGRRSAAQPGGQRRVSFDCEDMLDRGRYSDADTTHHHFSCHAPGPAPASALVVPPGRQRNGAAKEREKVHEWLASRARVVRAHSYRSSLTSVVGAVCNRRTRSGNRHSTIFRPSTPRRDAGPAHLLRPPLLSLPTCYALHFRHTRLTGCATAAAAPVSLVSLDMRSF
ncbi:hypothetical protein BJY59DRAFT_703636 [Rhodotorula toruloides]